MKRVLPWLLIAACDHHRDLGPTLAPLPPDARLGDVLFESFAGRGSHFLIGESPGGQVLAEFRPAGFELDDGHLVWQPEASHLWWLADGAHAATALEGHLPFHTMTLGVSLIEGATVGWAPTLEGTDIFIVHDGTTQQFTAPVTWLNDSTGWLVLGPTGDVLLGPQYEPQLCKADTHTCAPIAVASPYAPFAWDDHGILVSWQRPDEDAQGWEICVGYAVREGGPTPLSCAPASSRAAGTVQAGWQDPTHAQIPLWVQTIDQYKGVEMFTWTAGKLVQHDFFATECPPLVAPLAPTLQLREDLLDMDECPDAHSVRRIPHLQTLSEGEVVSYDLDRSWSWLACDCDRMTDADCDCFQRWPPTPQMYASHDAKTVRFFVSEPDLDGMTRLYARTIALPSDAAPYDDTPCQRSCANGACVLTEILSESCSLWNPYFHEGSLLPARVMGSIACRLRDQTPRRCGDWGGTNPTWTLTPIDPPDAISGTQSGEGLGFDVIVEANTRWEIHVEKAGFSSYTYEFDAPDALETFDFGTIPLYLDE